MKPNKNQDTLYWTTVQVVAVRKSLKLLECNMLPVRENPEN